MPASPAASLVATGVTRSHGAVVVLDGIDLTVGPTSRLGVVGPNGVGKTTLLRVLAGLDRPDAGQVRRAPPGLTVGYLPQETVADPGETLSVYLARRTGVAEAETDMHSWAERIGEGQGAEEHYSAALERFLALGGPELEARAATVCDDLGLPANRIDVDLLDLSGGQRARAALAAILLSRFDVLLLDEPTNDLDYDGLDRLERFLKSLEGGLVVVSHDRAFLEATVARVLEIDEHSRTATEIGGGWAGYLEAKAVARSHAEADYAEYTSQRDALRARATTQRQWAESGTRTAKKRPNDHDKAQQGWKVNRTEKQAAKVRITERAIDRLEVRGKPWAGWDLHLELAPTRRSGEVVARLVEAVVERGEFRLGPISLEVAWADRVAVVGPNGSGKTTLLRALLGDLQLASGKRLLGPGVVVGQLDQARQAVDGPTGTGQDQARPVLEAFTTASGLLPQDARSLLAKFGLGPEDVGRRAASLSPGERTRATLALLMASGANCLVLDEPTNHLDLPAIEQLEQALDTYDGTLLVVSHDRRFREALRLTRTVELPLG